MIGSALDPLVGAAGDTRHRRAAIFLGGVGFALAALLIGSALGFWTLLLALVLGNPSSGAFVGLAQATLMDLAPKQRERNMARWTLAGSFGYVGGPLLLAAALWLGLGWRGLIAVLGACALALLPGVRRLPSGDDDGHGLGGSLRRALAVLRDREVLRWLALLEAADLLLDIFHGYLALYFVDVAHVDAGAAALGVAVWTGSSLLGDWLLLPILCRMRGLSYLRLSAFVAVVVYPAFLLVPPYGVKLMLVAALGLLNSGWYAIPKAGLYDALPGRSGAAVAVGGIGGLVGACVPLVLGFVAGAAGLAATMWILLLAPVALLALLPRVPRSSAK